MTWFARAFAAAVLAVAALGAGGAGAAAPTKAIFAGGCFWCMEEAYEKVPGVLDVISGYTGGHEDNPTYHQVSAGGTGHFEAVEVEYDPDAVSYEQLLDVYWHHIDPFDPIGQFCDKGSQYRSAIFAGNDEEYQLAEETKAKVEKQFGQPVTTQILRAQTFYPAEDYHQDYYRTHAGRYKLYKFGCGRPQRLEEIWGKPGA
jgi:peptide-methionine (S)-S-oxide reductase